MDKEQEVKELAEEISIANQSNVVTPAKMAKWLIQAGYHRSVPDDKVREKIAQVIAKEFYNAYTADHITNGASLKCLEVTQQILALLPSRPSPPENRVEAIKRIILAYGDARVATVVTGISPSEYKEADEVARSIASLTPNGFISFEEHNRLVEVSRSAGKADGYKEGLNSKLTPELTLISDEEIEAKLNRELTDKISQNREELAELIVDIVHITKQAQLAADKKKQEG